MGFGGGGDTWMGERAKCDITCTSSGLTIARYEWRVLMAAHLSTAVLQCFAPASG